MTYRLDLQRALYKLVQEAERVQEVTAWMPTPGSPAASTRPADERWSNSDWGTLPMRDAYLSAALPIASSQDHLQLLAHAIGTGPLAFAYSTVARGAMEAAGRAWWLLDPSIDDTRRLGRYMTDRLYSWQETIRLVEGEAPDAVAGRAQQRQRIERMGACAERYGFKVHRTRGLPVAVGESRPKTTTLLEAVLADPEDGLSTGAMLYRVLSATAHATLYALLQPTTVVREHGDGSVLAGVAIDDDLLARITVGPVLAYSRAMASMADRWGWQDHLTAWSQDSYALATLLRQRL